MSTSMVGLLLGVLLIASWAGEAGAGKGRAHAHAPLQGRVKDKLEIIDLNKLEHVDAQHGWQLMIVYWMHGAKGDKNPGVAVTTSLMISGKTTIASLLDHKTGLHSHESVVALLRQMDHSDQHKDQIAEIEKNFPDFCEPSAQDTSKCYNHHALYKGYFHDDTDLHIYRMSQEELTGMKIGKQPEDVEVSGAPKDTVVHFLEKRRDILHIKNTEGHNFLQQILIKAHNPKDQKQVGVIVLYARDKDNIEHHEGKVGKAAKESAPDVDAP